MTAPSPVSATAMCTSPTGFSSVPPPGPAMPVIPIPQSAPKRAAAPKPPKPWRREDGRYRSEDDRFTIEGGGAGRWFLTDDEALALLVGRAFQTEGEALGKIIRSKQSSAQLSTYFVGRTAFHQLRQAVQRERGDRFELGRYHEAVLAHGTLPVKYLPELVRARLDEPR